MLKYFQREGQKILSRLKYVIAIGLLFIPSIAYAEKTVTLGIYQEPPSLNYYLGAGYVVTFCNQPFAEYLVDVDENGNFYPELVQEVPTVENGGVSRDGLTITYKLKPGLKWSDGAPVTSKDIRFTWQAVVNPKNLVKTRTGYSLIESVKTPDKLTAVVKFKEYFAPYLTLFAPILPEHVLGQLENINDAPFNRLPIGTGPFMVTEWVAGDHITMVKNPHYRDADKVKIDKLFFKVVPSREVGIAQINAGDIDMVWDLIEAQIPMMERNPNIALNLSPGLDSERMLLNLSTTKAPNYGNPRYPHPILGDLRVRQAIQYAIDKKVIAEKLLFGKAPVGTAEIPSGWASNPNIKPSEYNPEKAKRLLNEAGWIPGSDGIRQKDGKRLRLKITTTTGNKLREMSQQVMGAMLKQVGIDLYIENVPSSVLFSSWAKDSDRKKGRFDIVMYTTGPGIDPHAQIEKLFHSNRIPTDANGGVGANYSRHQHEELDKWIEIAGKATSIRERAAAYGKAQEIIDSLVVHIYLYRRISVDAFRTHVKGWKENGYGINKPASTWNIAEWYLEN
ncbi:MAG: peptide ABC transporter substrate-binding protein [Proteobacteria bacterium]|nr:peptide ABC transporter substrate-binding protein [Pseudomonadota bacterium]